MKPRVFSFRSVFSLTTRLKLGFSFISVHLRLLVGLHPLSFGFSFISVRFLHFFPFFGWRLGERRAPLGLRASALLNHLSLSRRRLAERRGMTRPSSVPLKIINNTNKNLPRGKSFQGEVSISPNFSTSGLRDFSVGWDGCQL